MKKIVGLPWQIARIARGITTVSLALAIAACGGGGDDAPPPAATPPATDTITGTAAVGAPVAGATVTLTSAAGTTATTTTSATGEYSISIESAPPYLLKVATSSGGTLYSFSSSGGVANLTPLTTLALHDAYGKKPLAALFDGWKSATVSAEGVLAAAKRINANFAALYTALDIDYKSYDFFTRGFSASGTGIDGVLDLLSVSYSCSSTLCSVSISVDGSSYEYDFSIDTADVVFSGGGGSSAVPSGSTWELTINGTVNGAPFNQTVGGIAAPAVPLSADGAENLVQDFGGISGGFTGPGMDIRFSYAGLTATYDGCGSCEVGSTITLKTKGSVTVSGTASGISIPPTTSNFDYIYTYKRIH